MNKQECIFVLQEICVNFVRFGGEDQNRHQLRSWVVAVLTTLSKLVIALNNIYQRTFINLLAPELFF